MEFHSPFALQGQCNTGWGVAPPEMDVPFQRNTATARTMLPNMKCVADSQKGRRRGINDMFEIMPQNKGSAAACRGAINAMIG